MDRQPDLTTRTHVPYLTGMLMSAYKQLQPAQRVAVDAIVRELEAAADRAGERITAALSRDIPQYLVSRDTRGMLALPMVQAAITERVREIGTEKELSPGKWLKHAMAVAFSNMGDYIRYESVPDMSAEGGEREMPVIDMQQCSEQQMAAVKSIKIETTGDGINKPVRTKIELTLHDKMGGLTMMGKYMGMVEPENPHWKADRSAQAQQVAQSDTVETAADRYQSLLEGS